MLDTHPDAPTSSAVPSTAAKTVTDAQSMLVTHPDQTATTKTNREVLAPPTNTDDQNVLDTHLDQAAPVDESNTASDDSCPGVVSILFDQLTEVRAQEFLPMQGKNSSVRSSVARGHNFAFPQQENPRKVAKAADMLDAKTKTKSKDLD